MDEKDGGGQVHIIGKQIIATKRQRRKSLLTILKDNEQSTKSNDVLEHNLDCIIEVDEMEDGEICSNNITEFNSSLNSGFIPLIKDDIQKSKRKLLLRKRSFPTTSKNNNKKVACNNLRYN